MATVQVCVEDGVERLSTRQNYHSLIFLAAEQNTVMTDWSEAHISNVRFVAFDSRLSVSLSPVSEKCFA